MKRLTIFWFALGAALLPATLPAETVRQGSNEQAALVARMQQMVNDVTAERDALRAQNARLAEELAEAEAAHAKQVQQLEKKLGGSETVLDKYKENDVALRERLAQDRARMQELVDKFRETAQNLRQVEMERGELKLELAGRQEELRLCTRKNLDLYQASLELLDSYEEKGVWDAMMQREPVTGLKRVDVENRIEEYRRRLDQMQVVGAGAAE
jgi:chromosome segregation ATPase